MRPTALNSMFMLFISFHFFTFFYAFIMALPVPQCRFKPPYARKSMAQNGM